MRHKQAPGNIWLLRSGVLIGRLPCSPSFVHYIQEKQGNRFANSYEIGAKNLNQPMLLEANASSTKVRACITALN